MKSSQNIDSNDMVVTAIGFFICIVIGLTIVSALIWSLEKERELGIHGRSSESLLLEHENRGEE